MTHRAQHSHDEPVGTHVVPDELFSETGHAMDGIAQAIDHLALGVQFDDHDTYAPVAARLVDDLLRVMDLLSQWQDAHGYRAFLARFDQVATVGEDGS